VADPDTDLLRAVPLLSGVADSTIQAICARAVRLAAVCTGHDYSKPGKPKIDRDDPVAKDVLVSALVNDANAVVEAFAGAAWTSRRPRRRRWWRWSPGRTWEPAEGSDGTDGRYRRIGDPPANAGSRRLAGRKRAAGTTALIADIA